MNRRSVRFTHIIGAGNQAVLGSAHYVDALLDDERVAAIGMYIEGFDDVNRFARAAQRALEKGVPIVVLKVGKTEASTKQSSSHTSSLTGSDELYDAFFDRLGIVRVNSLTRLLETLKIFDLAGPLTGRNIVSLSCSGGEAAIIADFLPEVGLESRPLSEAQVVDLEAQFPEWVTVSNPFDYNTSIWGDRKAMQRCFTTSMQGDHDSAFLVCDYPNVESAEADEWLDTVDAFIAAHETTGKPSFVVCSISELLPEAVRNRMLQRGVVPLQGLEDGLYAYAVAAHYYDRRADRLASMTLPRPIAELASGSDTTLDEFESKQQLAAHGLTIPDGEIGSGAAAAAIADRIGYPVVVKAVGAKFMHKSDLGAVAVNLADQDSVNRAVAAISANCASHDIVVDHFLVERMVESSVAELIVGVKHDEQFGPALVIGSGGILVELVADSYSLLLPVTRNDVRHAIDSLAVSKLINAYRGGVQGDIDALVDAVMSVAAYAEEHWSTLLELDVNPLMVLPAGKGAVAADALIVLRTSS